MKDFRAVKTELACYAVIIFAAFLMGFAIKNLYDPVNLVTGGVSGVAIIFKSLFDIPLWLTNTLLNIPLFLAAWRLKGWNFIKRTFIATVSLSVSLYVLPEMTIAGDDIFLSALFGGILSGVGTGILFAVHATTGGTDMLAALLHLKIRLKFHLIRGTLHRLLSSHTMLIPVQIQKHLPVLPLHQGPA